MRYVAVEDAVVRYEEDEAIGMYASEEEADRGKYNDAADEVESLSLNVFQSMEDKYPFAVDDACVILTAPVEVLVVLNVIGALPKRDPRVIYPAGFEAK